MKIDAINLKKLYLYMKYKFVFETNFMLYVLLTICKRCFYYVYGIEVP